MKKLLSDCCLDKVVVMGSTSGTNWYQCNECKKACMPTDLLSKSMKVKPLVLSDIEKYALIVAWLYENDMAHESKTAWRKSFISYLQVLFEI
jgi:hypothetical protein